MTLCCTQSATTLHGAHSATALSLTTTLVRIALVRPLRQCCMLCADSKVCGITTDDSRVTQAADMSSLPRLKAASSRAAIKDELKPVVARAKTAAREVCTACM
jgi:hypothetical protein